MASRPIVKISGAKLAQARRDEFLSQKQLGERAGLTESRIGQMEQSSIAGIPLNRVPLLAAALKITSQEFVGRIGVGDGSAADGSMKLPEHTPGESAQPASISGQLDVLLSADDVLFKRLRKPADLAGQSVGEYALDLLRQATLKRGSFGKPMRRAAKRMGSSRGKRQPFDGI